MQSLVEEAFGDTLQLHMGNPMAMIAERKGMHGEANG